MIAAPDVVTAAANDIARIGAAVSAANTTAAAATTGMAPAAADEVSAAIAALFGAHAQEYQAVSLQVADFHERFVQALNAAGAAYAQAEAEIVLLLQSARQAVLNLLGSPSGAAVDPNFISNTRRLGPFSITTAADPDDGFVAFVVSTPLGTNILTSGQDPSGNLGLGAAGVGLPGQTVNTLQTPFFTSTFAIPVSDPLAGVFTELVRLGF